MLDLKVDRKAVTAQSSQEIKTERLTPCDESDVEIFRKALGSSEREILDETANDEGFLSLNEAQVREYLLAGLLEGLPDVSSEKIEKSCPKDITSCKDNEPFSETTNTDLGVLEKIPAQCSAKSSERTGKTENSEEKSTAMAELSSKVIKALKKGELDQGSKEQKVVLPKDEILGNKSLEKEPQAVSILEGLQQNATYSVAEIESASFVSKVGHEIVEQILLCRDILDSRKEVMLQLSSDILADTRVLLKSEGSSLSVIFNTSSPISLDMVVANQDALHQFLENNLKNFLQINVKIENETGDKNLNREHDQEGYNHEHRRHSQE